MWARKGITGSCVSATLSGCSREKHPLLRWNCMHTRMGFWVILWVALWAGKVEKESLHWDGARAAYIHEGLVQDDAQAHGHVHNETGARNSLAAAALALIKLSHTLESAGANVNFCVALIVITNYCFYNWQQRRRLGDVRQMVECSCATILKWLINKTICTPETCQ